MRRVGLTGGIGSGKSTVCRILRDLGAWIVDTDAIAHRLTAPGGRAIPAIAAQFGAEVIAGNGAMDRARMRERVFADPAQRRALEAILHPMIGEDTRAEAAAAPEGAIVVFDVPLLVESGRWRDQVDRILVVDCPVETQIARVMQRNGWTADAVQRIIDQQASRAQRLAVADDVIVNDGLELEELAAEVRRIWSGWL
ncbi:dephospho-CoA kinase [Sphaerotilus montanus]|uniref:dephospho-CoA kinase n=1 Tax=Sphaerotilus montanus TaxID=522889 RepID=UPI0015CD9F7D|nr:dephospho-CoA kinase [Sphaerotilus montanus]NZD57012.1 dephospho-CoA kinase [Sphaerotilus montanus]